MSYQVLALKYRPQTFDTVVGQEHVTTTLANAISSDRVAHAILFTGPRGTGKTTIARIMAKAMNCEKGPSPIPCNTCKTCTQIIEGHCSDVFEIDGASNNSVDQIRDLRENVTYMPSSAKYKIYIIDEVHMLSTAAFNALLKTLEEPPDHVMFIFATTEVHKIPATILSRCQRHDLGRIEFEAITRHLDRLCKQEGFEIEGKSLEVIAQEADGSIRDSLSLLDRVLSSADSSKVDHQGVLDGLGMLDRQALHNISEAVFNNNGADVIEQIEFINNSGIDLKKYYSDLIEHFRNLSVIKICGQNSPAVNLPVSEKEKINHAIQDRASGYITNILQHLLNEENLVKYSSHPKTAIELILLKLLEINPGEQIDQIISRLDTLAKQIGSAPAKEPSMPDISHNTTNAHSGQQAERQIPVPSPQAEPEMRPESNIAPEKNVDKEKTWPDFLLKLEKKLPFFHALLKKALVKPKGNDEIMVELKDCSAFDLKRLESKKSKLQELCHSFLGKQLTLSVASKAPQANKNYQKKNETKAKHAAFNHPLVLDAQKMFNGQIINL